jgi:hypothetical protein
MHFVTSDEVSRVIAEVASPYSNRFAEFAITNDYLRAWRPGQQGMKAVG